MDILKLSAKKVLAILFALALTLAVIPSARAHDTLLSITPQDGAEIVQTELKEISLVFSANLLELGNVAQVIDSEGNIIFDGELAPSGQEVLIPIETMPQAGELTGTWRVVSSDGHPIEGQFSFNILPDPALAEKEAESAEANDTGEQAEQSADTSDSAGTSDSADTSQSADKKAEEAVETQAEAETSNQGSTLTYFLIAGVLAAILVGVVVAFKRKAKK